MNIRLWKCSQEGTLQTQTERFSVLFNPTTPHTPHRHIIFYSIYFYSPSFVSGHLQIIHQLVRAQIRHFGIVSTARAKAIKIKILNLHDYIRNTGRSTMSGKN